MELEWKRGKHSFCTDNGHRVHRQAAAPLLHPVGQQRLAVWKVHDGANAEGADELCCVWHRIHGAVRSNSLQGPFLHVFGGIVIASPYITLQPCPATTCLAHSRTLEHITQATLAAPKPQQVITFSRKAHIDDITVAARALT
jgi:hypothetical protein